VDTVKALGEIHPGADLFLIIGSDSLVELHTWHRVEELLQMCNVATCLRPGIESLDAIGQKIQMPERYRAKLMDHVVAAHRIGISSTEIRRRVAEGKGIRYLVPPAVEAYIHEQGLYQG